jgi:hypothetical protein
MDGCDAGVEVEMKLYNQAWLLRGRNVWIQLSLEYSEQRGNKGSKGVIKNH